MKFKGFTVIELIMVIVVIGIIAIVFFTQLSPYYNIKSVSAAHRILSDIRYAQQLAIQRHTDAGVVFDVDDNSYFVYITNTSTIAADPFSKDRS